MTGHRAFIVHLDDETDDQIDTAVKPLR